MPETCYYVWDIVLTIISILATVALSIIAVWQNSRYKKLADRKDEARKAEIDEENRLKIRPYLFTNCEEQPYEVFKDLSETSYIEIDDFYSDKQQYAVKNDLPVKIKESLISDDAVHRSFLLLSSSEEYCLIQYTVQNVGSGAAVNTKLLINSKGTINCFALGVQERKEIYFLLNYASFKDQEQIDLRIEIYYDDIEHKTKYKQEETITIHQIDHTEPMFIIDKSETISNPIIINKDEK